MITLEAKNMKRANQESVKCKVLRGFALGGGKGDALIGETVTLPVNEALVKQSQGKIEIQDGKGSRRHSPADRQSRDPKPDSRDPQHDDKSGGGAPDAAHKPG